VPEFQAQKKASIANKKFSIQAFVVVGKEKADGFLQTTTRDPRRDRPLMLL